MHGESMRTSATQFPVMSVSHSMSDFKACVSVKFAFGFMVFKNY